MLVRSSFFFFFLQLQHKNEEADGSLCCHVMLQSPDRGQEVRSSYGRVGESLCCAGLDAITSGRY